MKIRKLELPCEQAAYWLIKTYITKAYEISRLSVSSKDEKDFSRLIRGISLSNWNTIFMILSKCIQNINNRESFSQTTSKGEHTLTDVIIEETLEKLGILGINEKLPSIDLTEKQSTCSTIDMGIDARNVFVSTKKGRSKLPKYTINYDFVLSSDDSELRFYNLILSIIVSVRRKNNHINSLNIIKEVFCERANVHDAAIVFDRVIEVLREYSIIKVETKGKKNIIVEWPIDEGIIGVEYFSDVIIRRCEEVENSHVKDYTPPLTREERREITGESAARKKQNISERVLKEMQSTEELLSSKLIPFQIRELEEAFVIEAYCGEKTMITFNKNGVVSLSKSNVVRLSLFPDWEVKKMMQGKQSVTEYSITYDVDKPYYAIQFLNKKCCVTYQDDTIEIQLNDFRLVAHLTEKRKKVSYAGNDGESYEMELPKECIKDVKKVARLLNKVSDDELLPNISDVIDYFLGTINTEDCCEIGDGNIRK